MEVSKGGGGNGGICNSVNNINKAKKRKDYYSILVVNYMPGSSQILSHLILTKLL